MAGISVICAIDIHGSSSLQVCFHRPHWAILYVSVTSCIATLCRGVRKYRVLFAPKASLAVVEPWRNPLIAEALGVFIALLFFLSSKVDI